ncbi:hypothetical protein BWQ96_05799 [Gracilariopsis chorda]|uniref:Uncharacterized protein n=1 Tax=Gracilariopsis chorda TaxID=448386 RepID=A0A2V3IQS8_9FLOR|nr:hypothetical protein BWQ96_05799 [Gracilariopsis chorda]|eukprot:PXF44471.1 hypothetical protein BWQ96_05799 [Gracilariopsis chorda]
MYTAQRVLNAPTARFDDAVSNQDSTITRKDAVENVGPDSGMFPRHWTPAAGFANRVTEAGLGRPDQAGSADPHAEEILQRH